MAASSSFSSSSTSWPRCDPPSEGEKLQMYNVELVKALKELKNKRNGLSQQIEKEEKERSRLQNDAAAIAAQIQCLEASLGDTMRARNTYDRMSKFHEAAGTVITHAVPCIYKSLSSQVESIQQPAQSVTWRRPIVRFWRAVRHSCTCCGGRAITCNRRHRQPKRKRASIEPVRRVPSPSRTREAFNRLPSRAGI